MLNALRVLDDAEIARAYKFTPLEIRYVVWHVDPKAKFTPTDDVITKFLESLRDGLAAIESKPVAIDVSGVVTQTYLDAIFGAGATADEALEIVAGTSSLSGAAQETFIDTNFGAFVNTTEAKAKLVTAGSSLLVGADARFGYMQPIVQKYIDRQTLVIDRVASAFGITNVAADRILRTYVYARGSAGAIDSTKRPLVLLTGLNTTGVLNLSTAPAYWYTYLHLSKVGLVVSRFKLADDDLAWTFVHGPLAFDSLPVVTTQSPSIFANWSRLVRAAQLRDAFLEKKLFDIFEGAWVGGSVSAILSDISDRTGWSNEDLTYIAANLSPTIASVNDFKDERALVRLKKAIDVCGRLELPAKTALPWADTTYGAVADEATAIKEAIRGTFDAEAWPGVVKPVRDEIRERQRDAMVSYLVATETGFESANDLSDDLLMDVQVGACAKTSRIKQAISSTQTFIQRVFLNYEEDVVFTTDDARQWQWMKAFRLWEANRKIFLYPENWIEPTLRDNKSELFEKLETDLSKGELTSDLIEDALLAYLHGLDEVAHLDPVASVVEEDSDLSGTRLHVVTRTKAQPPVHFYRVRETNGRWLGWRRMNVDVQSDHVAMAIYHRRPYLLWAQVQAHVDSFKKIELYRVGMRWSSLHLGKWAKVQQCVGTIDAGQDSHERAPSLGLYFGAHYTIESTTNDLVVRLVDPDRNHKDATYQADTGAVLIFRMSGSRGTAHARAESQSDSLTARNLRKLAPSQTKAVANYYERDGNGLGLPDVLNSYTKNKSQQIDVLSFSTSPYLLTVESAQDEVWAERPMFFSDDQRAFLIEPTPTLVFPTTVPPVPPAPPPDSTNSVVVVWSHLAPQDKLDFAQDPSSGGGGSYSPKLLNSNAVIARPTTHTAYTFTPFDHPYVADELIQLNRLGIDGVYDPQPGTSGEPLRRQAKQAASNAFELQYQPSEWVTTPYPRDQFDFSAEGTYSLYNWELFFHVPLLIATKLAADQQFEAARKWFHFIFNPTEPKAPSSTETAPQRFWKVKPFYAINSDEVAAEGPIQILKRLLSHDDDDPDRLAELKRLQAQVREWHENPFEPHRIARLRPVAYMKTTVIKYLDMLIAWGDQLYSRATLESINEALQIYQIAYRVLGKRPTKLPPQTPSPFSYETIPSSLGEFSEALLKIEVALPPVNENVETTSVDAGPLDHWSMVFCVPPNDKLLGYWGTVEDRLFKIRHCLNLQGIALDLPLFEPPIDPGLLVRARAAGIDIGSLLSDVTAPVPLQRYAVLAQRANELTAEVKALGQSFLSALEKKDAEELALLRAGQEIQMLQAMRTSKAQAVVDTARAREAVELSRDAATAKRDYYASRVFENPEEKKQQEEIGNAATRKIAAEAVQALSAPVQAIPTFHLTFPPVTEIGGTQLAAIFTQLASGLSMLSTIHEMEGQLAGIQGSFRRRADEWEFQRAQAEIEIKNLEKQIVAAEIREAIAQNDLDTQDLQIQSSLDVRDFMRDKFTNVALYDWMVSELSATYFQAYRLAFDAAKRAERAWKFEIYVENPNETSFINFGYWDGLRKGLLAGEKLSLDIKRMEMAYLDKNVRDFELVRHLPLTMLEPISLQELRETGTTIVSIPEAVFDADTPGHYFRRLRNVSVTIAGVTGPYTSVRCTLTLLGSSIRRTPSVAAEPEASSVPIQSIVTSTGRDDGGLFETNLRDERYLPFEGAGAISTWRIELPRPSATIALPVFDYRTISELVLHLRYTARQGGADFRDDVMDGEGTLTEDTLWKLGFSVKSVFSDEWFQFLSATGDADIVLKLDRDHLPFRAGDATIESLQFTRIQKGTPSGPISITTAPTGTPSPISLTSSPSVLNGQATGAADYASEELQDFTVTATVADFTADDDLFVVVTYKVPAAS